MYQYISEKILKTYFHTMMKTFHHHPQESYCKSYQRFSFDLFDKHIDMENLIKTFKYLKQTVPSRSNSLTAPNIYCLPDSVTKQRALASPQERHLLFTCAF